MRIKRFALSWDQRGKLIKRRLQTLIVLGAAMALSAMSAPMAFAQPPANDDITNATVVTGVPFADGPIDTTEATAAITDPQDCSNNGSNWYTFTPTVDVSIEANTIGSDYDTTIGVYSGSPGSLSLVKCNDDFYGLQSAGRFNATANTTYYFMAGFCCGNGGTGGGQLFFNVREIEPVLDIELGVDSPGSVKNGVATVGGTVTCNVESAFTQVYGTLRQRAGRSFITGSFFADLGPCSPPGISWSATVTGDRVFVGGNATIEATSSGCDFSDCDSDSVSTTIRLKGAR